MKPISVLAKLARALALRAVVATMVWLSGVSMLSAAQADWKKDWDQTVEAARKEGQLVIYGSHPAFP